MQRSCNSTDAQRRKLKSDFCDTQYVVVFEEFEFCIKELVFFFEEHISDQYYVYGDANGHASIDCLIAARQVLDERGISQGKYLLNAGA